MSKQKFLTPSEFRHPEAYDSGSMNGAQYTHDRYWGFSFYRIPHAKLIE